MHVRVYNYNTMDKVKQFEAHTDYIRCGCLAGCWLGSKLQLVGLRLQGQLGWQLARVSGAALARWQPVDLAPRQGC